MVDCYCGCDTRANRIKFAVAGTLYVIGIFLVLSFAALPGICSGKIYWECHMIQINGDTDSYVKYGCEEALEELSECWQKQGLMWYLVAASLGELLLILATIPLCMLCCCTKKPQEGAFIGTPPVAVRQGNTYEAI